MTLISIYVLALMALLNYLMGGRRLLYPPVAFCSVWAGTLALVWLSGELFFPISAKTLAIFCGVALAFSAGSALAALYPHRAVSEQALPRVSSHLLDAALLAVAVSVPLIYNWIMGLASGFAAATVLMAARMAMLDVYERGQASLLYGGLIVLSMFLAMVYFLERENRRGRMILAVLIAFGLNVLGGGRGGFVGLIFAFICIDWFRGHRLRWKPLVAMLLVLATAFSAVGVMVGKADADPNASLSDNLGPLLQGFALYAGGGIAGFDQVVRQPKIIPHNWQITRFFLETANRLGARYDVPPLHADYVNVGPRLWINVYSMYFVDIDLGYGGMMIATLVVGLIVGLFYCRALQGRKVAILVYSVLFGAMMLSPFNENFFMGLNYLTKVFLLAWLVYRLPVTVTRAARLLRQPHFPESDLPSVAGSEGQAH